MGQNFYKRDDRDIQFVLKEQLGVERLLTFEKYSDFSMEDLDMILEQAQKIAAETVAPTFQDADREGCRYVDGQVLAPSSFKKVWQVFQEGGWIGLNMNPEYGGQGAPLILAEAVSEFFMSANFAFGCYSGMGPGNGLTIEKFGSQEQKDLFLEKMYDGTWGGAMCLTEPQVGSDAHMVSTKAIPEGDYYKIQGTKIFITSGDHDLTENIIHLVIARIEGAPEGAKGVSLFAVPKIWVNDDGTMGEPNDVVCAGIEHKMGLSGSATCVMNYGENGNCRGRLVGQPGMGLAYMFQMVNLARMAVGLESVAFGANIYANVLDYAKDRVQGVPFGRRDGGRARIVEHADVRRMLMNLKSLTEGMRALVYKTYFVEDLSHNSPDPEERRISNNRLELFTPIVKAYCSDRIFEMGREGIQILGGYGFTKEYPVEQYTRDCKILSIWDGTNYIQSVDLVGRKLSLDAGRAFEAWVDEITDFLKENQENQDISKDLALMREVLDVILGMRVQYGAFMKEGKLDLIPLSSTRFLDSCAELAISHLLMEQYVIAARKLQEVEAGSKDYNFYKGKMATAKYYVRNFLPNVFGRLRSFELEDLTAVELPEECL